MVIAVAQIQGKLTLQVLTSNCTESKCGGCIYSSLEVVALVVVVGVAVGVVVRFEA